MDLSLEIVEKDIDKATLSLEACSDIRWEYSKIPLKERRQGTTICDGDCRRSLMMFYNATTMKDGQ